MSLALASRRAAISPSWVRNALWRNARAVPSLDLQFADTKSLADAISGQNLITFTRASSATYVGSDGLIKTAATNEARFDHNPTTGESLGLMVEEQRTNLTLWSQVIRLTEWPSQQATTQAINQSTAPDNSNTANTLIENTQNANRFIGQTIAVTNTSHTWSVFAKAKERRRILLRENTTSGAAAAFDVVSGSVVGTEAGASASITAYANGWFRCSMTYTPSASSSRLHTMYLLPDSGTSFATASYLGDGTSGIYLWGAQLEAGAFATSYIPTTTATVTRSADVASITGTNFSSWYRQDEGTVYYEGTVSQGLAAFPWFYNISDGTVNNSIGVYQFTNGIYGSVVASGVAATPDPSVLFSPTSGASAKHTLAARSSDTRAAYNGTLSSAQTNTVMPTVNTLSIGQRVTGNRMTGTIRRLTYWPQRLPNSTLQALTQ